MKIVLALLFAFPMIALAELKTDSTRAFPYKSCTRHVPHHPADRVGFEYDASRGTLMMNWGPNGKYRYYDYKLRDPNTKAWIGDKYARFTHTDVIRPSWDQVYTTVYDLLIRGNQGAFTVTYTNRVRGYPDHVFAESVSLTNCRN